MAIQPASKLEEQALEILRGIPDPEMPISIVDLGIVHAVRAQPAVTNDLPAIIEVDITPTFVGCPALEMLTGQIRERVGRLAGVGDVRVQFLNSPRWSVDQISDAGREALRAHGIAMLPRGAAQAARGAPLVALTVAGQLPTPHCPFCDSQQTKQESPFGPARCRMIYYCEACRNSFEMLRPM